MIYYVFIGTLSPTQFQFQPLMGTPLVLISAFPLRVEAELATVQ